MKKLSIILGLLLFCFQGVSASEIEAAQTFNENRGTIAIQKQPSKENKQEVKSNWFCIVIQVNGKLKADNTSDPDNK